MTAGKPVLRDGLALHRLQEYASQYGGCRIEVDMDTWVVVLPFRERVESRSFARAVEVAIERDDGTILDRPGSVNADTGQEWHR
jgi:hypothetical protein